MFLICIIIERCVKGVFKILAYGCWRNRYFLTGRQRAIHLSLVTRYPVAVHGLSFTFVQLSTFTVSRGLEKVSRGFENFQTNVSKTMLLRFGYIAVTCSDRDRQQGVSTKLKNFLFNGLDKSETFSDWESGMHYRSLYQQGGRVERIMNMIHSGGRRELVNPTHWYLTCAIGLTEIIEQMSPSEIIAVDKNLRLSAFDSKLNFEPPDGLWMNGLHMAIMGSNEATVEVLLRKGVSISEGTDRNETCLRLAIACNNPVVIDLLCSAGADPNESFPVKMKYTGGMINHIHLDPQRRAFDRRPQTAMGFRQQTRTVFIDEDIETPLHFASFCGNELTVTALLKWGADINARSCLGSTMLHKAMEGDHQHVAILLIEAGADVSTPLMYGRTPLHLAAAMGQDKLVKCLLEYGANALARDHFGKSAQEIAQRYGHRGIVQMLKVAALAIPVDEIPASSYMLGASIEEIEAAGRKELDLRQAYLGEHEIEVSDSEEKFEYSLLRSYFRGEERDKAGEQFLNITWKGSKS